VHNGRSGPFRPGTKEPFVFSCGRLWDEGKGADVLARIAPRLSWPIHLAGDTRAPGGGERTLAGVPLLGRLDEAAMAGWLGRAGLFLLPARYEPFGLSVLEAAMSGCPLVLGDIPSLRELWDGAALFVDPDRPAQVTDTVEAVVADPMLRASLGARALARADRYTAERMVEGYLRCYRHLAAGSHVMSLAPAAPRAAAGGQRVAS
jgi:glycogen synthase